MVKILSSFFLTAIRPKLVAAALGAAVVASGGQLVETSNDAIECSQPD